MIKATDRKLVVGLEIGTAKVAALVGEVLPDGMINIIGVGSCPSRGMDKGEMRTARHRPGRTDGGLPDFISLFGTFG